MFEKSLTFDLPKYYDLSMTCHAHGWKNLAPFRWNDDSKTIYFAALIDQNPVDFAAWQHGASLKAALTSHDRMNQGQISEAKKVVIRTLGLNMDTAGLLKAAERVGLNYVNLVKKGAGRLLRSPTLWEDAAKTLFTTNCSWALTKKLSEAVCSQFFSETAPSGSCPFPTPQKITKHSPKQIKGLIPIGYRADYLIALAEHLSQDPSLSQIESNGYSYKEAYSVVNSLKGFGGYASTHLLVLTGYYNEIPIDTVVISYLKQNHRVRKPQSFIDRTYQKWGAYKWWGLKLEKMLRHQNWLGD